MLLTAYIKFGEIRLLSTLNSQPREREDTEDTLVSALAFLANINSSAQEGNRFQEGV
jgi:hypothetical protein